MGLPGRWNLICQWVEVKDEKQQGGGDMLGAVLPFLRLQSWLEYTASKDAIVL